MTTQTMSPKEHIRELFAGLSSEEKREILSSLIDMAGLEARELLGLIPAPIPLPGTSPQCGAYTIDNTYTLTLVSFAPERALEIVKLLREMNSELGLFHAVRITRNLPQDIACNLSEGDANSWKSRFQAISGIILMIVDGRLR